MKKRIPRFGKVARLQQGRFRETLCRDARVPFDDKGQRHSHLLAHEHEMENLYPDLRSPGGALDFFRERSIPWWRSARSGDRTRHAYEGPTRNLASSQVSCINFLLPLAVIPGALRAFLRVLDIEAEEIVPIVDQTGCVSPVEIEWVGWHEPLEGGRLSRGANATSIDAVLVARTATGAARAYLIEWKYCEEYPRPKDKGAGEAGVKRTSRYKHLYLRPTSSFHGSVAFEELLFEPFYQLMRMHLLGDRIVAEGVTPDLKVDDVRVVVVCPKANEDYRTVVATTPLAKRWPGVRTVEDAFRRTLKHPERFAIVAQEDIVASLRASRLSGALQPWLDYHSTRYGW